MDELHWQLAQSTEAVARTRRAHALAIRRVEEARLRRDAAVERLLQRGGVARALAPGDRASQCGGILTIMARLDAFYVGYIKLLEEERDRAHELIDAEARLAQAQRHLALAGTELPRDHHPLPSRSIVHDADGTTAASDQQMAPDHRGEGRVTGSDALALILGEDKEPEDVPTAQGTVREHAGTRVQTQPLGTPSDGAECQDEHDRDSDDRDRLHHVPRHLRLHFAPMRCAQRLRSTANDLTNTA